MRDSPIKWQTTKLRWKEWATARDVSAADPWSEYNKRQEQASADLPQRQATSHGNDERDQNGRRSEPYIGKLYFEGRHGGTNAKQLIGPQLVHIAGILDDRQEVPRRCYR